MRLERVLRLRRILNLREGESVLKAYCVGKRPFVDLICVKRDQNRTGTETRDAHGIPRTKFITQKCCKVKPNFLAKFNQKLLRCLTQKYCKV